MGIVINTGMENINPLFMEGLRLVRAMSVMIPLCLLHIIQLIEYWNILRTCEIYFWPFLMPSTDGLEYLPTYFTSL